MTFTSCVYHEMKITNPLCFTIILPIAGCISSKAMRTVQPTPSLFTCNQPGMVQSLTVSSVGDIGVYLPTCYDPKSNTLYPMLYLLPGFGGTYREWLETGLALLTHGLIQSREIPPLMIVTTGNTYDELDPEQNSRFNSRNPWLRT